MGYLRTYQYFEDSIAVDDSHLAQCPHGNLMAESTDYSLITELYMMLLCRAQAQSKGQTLLSFVSII